MAVYIIKFSEKLHHAGHYIGSCADWRVQQRLEEHRAGRGARICRAAVQRGIQLNLIAVLPGYYEEERRIKFWHNTPKYVEMLKRKGIIQ